MSMRAPRGSWSGLQPAPVLAGALACTLAAAGCTTNPSTGRSQLLLMSTQQAIAIGDESKGPLTDEYGGEVPSTALHAYVVEVGSSMAQRTEAQYLDSIAGKTASLFATSARIGGIVAGHPREWIDALTAYGKAYGMLFQIVDDVLDIPATDAELGKPAGHDMEEGVYTLPVLRALAADDEIARELRSMLGRPLTVEERDQALVLARGSAGPTQAIDVAAEYVRVAEGLCDAFAPCAAICDS